MLSTHAEYMHSNFFYIFKDLNFLLVIAWSVIGRMVIQHWWTNLEEQHTDSPTQNRHQQSWKSNLPTFQINTFPEYGREDQSIKLTQMKIISGKNDKFTHINGRVSDQHKAPLGEWAKANERYGKMLFIMHGRDESPDSGIYKEFL